MIRCKMALGFVLMGFIATAQDSLRYKPSDEFEAKIDLSFKKRASDGINTFKFSESAKKRTMDTPIAFLTIHFKILKLNNEVKMKVLRGREGRTTKIKVGSVEKIEMGFIEDIKSNGQPAHIILRFLNDQKVETCQVILMIDEDGTFLVNGQKRGKF